MLKIYDSKLQGFDQADGNESSWRDWIKIKWKLAVPARHN